MPEDRLDDAIEVLLELPGEPALADAGLTDDRDEPGLAFAFGRVEVVLERAELLVATDERRLDASRSDPTRRVARRPRSACQPGTGAVLPFSDCSPTGSKAIAPDAARYVASPTRTVPGHGHRLEPRGGVDEVAGDHPLAVRADGHDGLPGQDPGPALQGRAVDLDPADRVDQLEGGPDRAFGVVLVGDGRAPDGHHRIADELLDHAAVAGHDLAGGREVAIEEVADLLRRRDARTAG